MRAVFVIDPARKIRALVYYPMNAGRNIDEILRLVDALQTADANGVSCQPTGARATTSSWRPRTTEALARAKVDDSLQRKDWFLATKTL